MLPEPPPSVKRELLPVMDGDDDHEAAQQLLQMSGAGQEAPQRQQQPQVQGDQSTVQKQGCGTVVAQLCLHCMTAPLLM